MGYWERQPPVGKVALALVALVLVLVALVVLQSLLGSTGHGHG